MPPLQPGTSYLLTSHLGEARRSPRLRTSGQADSPFHRQRGEEGAQPRCPPCLHAAHAGFAAPSPAPRLPSRAPRRGGWKQTNPNPSLEMAGPCRRRREPSVPGLAGATAFHGSPATVLGATLLPAAPLRCPPPFPRQPPCPATPDSAAMGNDAAPVTLRVRAHTHTCMRSRASRAFHGQPGRHQPVLPACATLQDELPLARGHGEAAGPLRDYSPTAAGWGCSLIPGQNWSLSHPVPSQGTGAHTHPSLCAAGHHPRPANPAHPTTPQTKDIPRAFPRSKAPSRLCPAPLVHLSPPEHP